MKKSNQWRDMWLEILYILIGEIVVSALVALVFYLIGQFSPSVIYGGLLGSLVTVLNYLILSVAVNRAIDRFIEKRGDGEMDEDEAAAFASENSQSVTLAARGTYMLRMLIMLGVLVGAFLLNKALGLEIFNVIATLVPLLAFRPIIFVLEFIRSKFQKREV